MNRYGKVKHPSTYLLNFLRNRITKAKGNVANSYTYKLLTPKFLDQLSFKQKIVNNAKLLKEGPFYKLQSVQTDPDPLKNGYTKMYWENIEQGCGSGPFPAGSGSSKAEY